MVAILENYWLWMFKIKNMFIMDIILVLYVMIIVLMEC
jgi:hypothetical protein